MFAAMGAAVATTSGCGGGGAIASDAGAADAGAADTGAGAAGEMPGTGGRPGVSGSSAGDCLPPPPCDTPLPDLGGTVPWQHGLEAALVTIQGDPRHRGRDLYLRVGDPQWALGKFAYGPADADLQDELVDIYLFRGCGSTWELLGTQATTSDGDHQTVEGVEDTGGRVYWQIPAEQALEVGRHRLVFVVKGDHSTATQYIDVLPADARFVVTDMDGTQTESETADFVALFTGEIPEAQPAGADLLWAFARQGYRIFYLTARPDWLHTYTHDWLMLKGYPPGNVHTTFTFTGAIGNGATEFKTNELLALLHRFAGAVEYGIGNTAMDAAAYAAAGLDPSRSYLYQYDPGPGGTRVDDYAALVPMAEALPPLCPRP
jgi:hypothetical protein